MISLLGKRWKNFGHYRWGKYGRISLANESLTVCAIFGNITTLKAQCAANGFSARDLVVLSRIFYAFLAPNSY